MRMKREDWDRFLATNLTATFRARAGAIRHDLSSARPHHRYQFSGRADGQRRADQLCGVEGGLMGFAKRWRARWPRAGSRSNVVAPGLN